jgi:hypothetical protein
VGRTALVFIQFVADFSLDNHPLMCHVFPLSGLWAR